MRIDVRACFVVALAAGLPACERHDVDVEPPSSGRALSATERRELQSLSDAVFHDARRELEGLPPHLTLIVRWGKDVIPETGESAAAAYPGNVGLTLDPDVDVLATIRTHVRGALFHELHHLARASRVSRRTLVDHVVTEGLAIAYERAHLPSVPPWGEAPPAPLEWWAELRAVPEPADVPAWMIRHPDGRRWIGMRVGTFLVERATKTSGRSAAKLVFAPTEEVVRLAELR